MTAEHTVRIDESRITEILGKDAGLATAQDSVRNALSGTSLATLKLAKAYAEDATGRGRT